MAKRKKLKAKQLKHDPFRDWYEKQAEWARHHREPIRRTLVMTGVIIGLLVASSLGYTAWKGVAERRLAEAYDIFHAEVSDTPPAHATERTYKTEEEKYRAALEAYKRVGEKWYFKFSDAGAIARYYEAVCQLHLKSSEGQALLERLAQGNSMTARLARLALAEHLLGQGEAARAETLYRQLKDDPGQLPEPQLKLGLARAVALQGKKAEAIALYLELAKERRQELEGSEAVRRLAELDPAALDQLPPESSPPAPRDVLSRYKKK